MSSIRTFAIHNEVDLVTARMHVRETARHLGMSLTDQSRISLATSSLANALGLGREGKADGRVVVDTLQNGARQGLRVVCTRNDCGGYTPPLSYFGNERWMVDELELRSISSDEVEVTMIKWVNR